MSVIARFQPLEIEARYASNQGGGARQPSVAANADTEIPMSIDELKGEQACFQCQKPGHLKKNCPDAGRAAQPRGNEARGCDGRRGRGGGSNRPVECHRCYRSGHIAKDCQAACTTHQTSVNELATAEVTSEAGAVAASQEPATALNPYAPAWTSDALGCMSEQAGIYTLSDAGRDDPA